MSRRASVKETGEEISADDWRRFEAAVQDDLRQRQPSAEPVTEEREISQAEALS